jgi:hypothetical protein
MPTQAWTCRCSCGAAHFQLNGEPITRFICHCGICQRYTGRAFGDVAAFWRSTVQVHSPFPVTFRRYRPPPNVSRGLCQRCDKPVVEFMTLAPFVRIAFVPADNVVERSGLMPARAHIFYDRRLADADDELPKYSGYWPSEWQVIRLLMTGSKH